MIVIVDDSADDRRLMRLILEGAGYQPIREAATVDAGMRLIRQVRPRLVLTDLMIIARDAHWKSGLDLIDEMQADPDLRAIPIVMATAFYLDGEPCRKAIEKGARSVIGKLAMDQSILAAVRREIGAP